MPRTSNVQSRISHLPVGNSRASGRNSPITPHRTPRTPSMSMPMTAEKQKPPFDDKEAMSAMNVKILEALAEIGGYNDIVQKGLRVMTVKQFVSILQHFLVPILGSLPDNFEAGYKEQVGPIMQQLEYPYQIQKSFLMTPGLASNLNASTLLLSYIIDFSKFDYEPIEYTANEIFSSPDMTRDVTEKMVEYYRTYRDGTLGREEAEHCIVNHYRQLLIGVDPNLTLEINRIEDEIQEMSDANKPSTLAKELHVKMTEVNGLEAKIRMHQENIVELSRKKENANAELGMSRNAKRSSHDEAQRLHAQLSRQKFNIDIRHNMLVEITQMKSALASKKNAVMELREASSGNEILLSNLISKKFQLIDRLNNMLCKISSDMKIAGIGEKFNADEFVINSTKKGDLDHHLEHVSRGMMQLKEIYLSALSTFKEKLIKLEDEHQKLSIKNDLQTSKLAQLKTSLKQLIVEEKNLELEYKSYLQNIQTEHVGHQERIENIEREIEERTKGIEQLKLDVEEIKEKKSEFGAKAVSECEKLYDERKKEVETRRKTIEQNNAAIDNYKKNKTPLPANLQKILDGVLSKRANKENDENSSKES